MLIFLGAAQFLLGCLFFWKALSSNNEDNVFGVVGAIFSGLAFFTAYALLTLAFA